MEIRCKKHFEVPFREVLIGELFKHADDYCIKTPTRSVNINKTVNAVCLGDGDYRHVWDDDEVYVFKNAIVLPEGEENELCRH